MQYVCMYVWMCMYNDRCANSILIFAVAVFVVVGVRIQNKPIHFYI